MAKYSKGAGAEVKEAMHEMKQGKLKSGSGQKVTNPKQAIAIALSEARQKGEKVPRKATSKKAASKKSTKGSASKKGVKKVSAKKAASKKPAKKAAAKKSTR